MTVENISWSISTKECCRPGWGLNPRPPGLQSDGASNWATEAGIILMSHNVSKRTFRHERSAKIQISLRIRAVEWEASLVAFWKAMDVKDLNADNEASNQSARMRRLIWVFVGRSCQEVRFSQFVTRIGYVFYLFCQGTHGPRHDTYDMSHMGLRDSEEQDQPVRTRIRIQGLIRAFANHLKSLVYLIYRIYSKYLDRQV